MGSTAEHLNTVEDVRRRIPVGSTTIQRYIRTGALRSVKVGGRRLIPDSAIDEFIRAAQETSNGSDTAVSA